MYGLRFWFNPQTQRVEIYQMETFLRSVGVDKSVDREDLKCLANDLNFTAEDDIEDLDYEILRCYRDARKTS